MAIVLTPLASEVVEDLLELAALFFKLGLHIADEGVKMSLVGDQVAGAFQARWWAGGQGLQAVASRTSPPWIVIDGDFDEMVDGYW